MQLAPADGFPAHATRSGRAGACCCALHGSTSVGGFTRILLEDTSAYHCSISALP